MHIWQPLAQLQKFRCVCILPFSNMWIFLHGSLYICISLILDDTKVVYTFLKLNLFCLLNQKVYYFWLYLCTCVWLHGYLYISSLLVKTNKVTFDYFGFYGLLIQLCFSATQFIKNLLILINDNNANASILYLACYDKTMSVNGELFILSLVFGYSLVI